MTNPTDKMVNLSVREHFATVALQGLLADPTVVPGSKDRDAEIARLAVRMADALIEALNAKE